MYLDINKIMSYNLPIHLIIGARGIGKTYGVKTWVLKRVLASKCDEFIWLRATETMCDKLKENKGQELLKDALLNNEFGTDFKYEITGDNSIVDTTDEENKRCIGHLQALSTFYTYKGNAFPNVKYIIFDEFIPEESEVIRGNRILKFVNVLETILRNRTDAKIFLLSNALNVADDLLCLFFNNVEVGKFGHYINNEKDAVLHYMDNSAEYNNAREKSIVGKILKNTPYEETIIKNRFITYDFEYFASLPPSAKEKYLLVDENYKIMLYEGDGLIFAKSYYGKRKIGYCKDSVHKIANCYVMNNVFKNYLNDLHNNNLIRFENENVRLKLLSFIK